jgi:signal transduction histidine kinase
MLLVCATIISSVIGYNCLMKSQRELSEISQRIEATYFLLLKDVNVTRTFFENETINPKYFETGKSKLLDMHYSICKQIFISLEKLSRRQSACNFELDEIIIKLKKDLSLYNSLTLRIEKRIFERGFKDYGIEGKMRNYAHELENYSNEIGLINVLQLRRHEKDFIIRQEDIYIDKYKDLIGKVRNKVVNNHSITSGKRIAILNALDYYYFYFNRLTLYAKRIGLKTTSGLKTEIDANITGLELKFNTMLKMALKKENEGLQNIQTVFIISLLIFLAFSVVAAMYISKRASRSIIDLKEKILEFVKSDFTVRTIIPITDSKYEVDILANNFSIMEQHIVNQMTALKHTNKELEMLFYRSSHDIRGPLTTMKGLINLATQEVSDPKALAYFSMVNQSCMKLSDIVDELGMVNLIKSEKIKTENIEFETLIRSVFKEFNQADLYNDILLSTSINLKETFYSDPKLVETIFRQLIENSIKYSKKRNGISYAKVFVSEEKNNFLKIIVADNGIGIEKEYHEKIFEMFFRATNVSKGTGMGLFIVQNSLQKLNGAISVESDTAVGTTFTILLPNKKNKKNAMERIIQKKLNTAVTDNLILNYI